METSNMSAHKKISAQSSKLVVSLRSLYASTEDSGRGCIITHGRRDHVSCSVVVGSYVNQKLCGRQVNCIRCSVVGTVLGRL